MSDMGDTLSSDGIGYLESAQWLQSSGYHRDQQQLLAAARAAELHNTGWPIGVVLDAHGLAPRPTAEGIETRLGKFGEGRYDYWTLTKEGRFYFLRTFEEDTEKPTYSSYPPPSGRVIWWDTRIWRIAEAVLHSAVLYRELGVPGDTPYSLSVNHHGLTDREFYCSSPGRYLTRRGSFCREPSAVWTLKVTQDVVIAGLKGLVAEIAKELFLLFDFEAIPRASSDQIVAQFLKSRV